MAHGRAVVAEVHAWFFSFIFFQIEIEPECWSFHLRDWFLYACFWAGPAFFCLSQPHLFPFNKKTAPGESSDIFIAVMELWTASEIKREIRWEGEGALHVNDPGRVQKPCSSHLFQVAFAKGPCTETCSTTFCVESEVKRMCPPCRTSYYKIT